MVLATPSLAKIGLEGRWRAEGGEEAYAELREKYLAREPVTFRAEDGTETTVVVASWFRDDHPGSLVIRSVPTGE